MKRAHEKILSDLGSSLQDFYSSISYTNIALASGYLHFTIWDSKSVGARLMSYQSERSWQSLWMFVVCILRELTRVFTAKSPIFIPNPTFNQINARRLIVTWGPSNLSSQVIRNDRYFGKNGIKNELTARIEICPDELGFFDSDVVGIIVFKRNLFSSFLYLYRILGEVKCWKSLILSLTLWSRDSFIMVSDISKAIETSLPKINLILTPYEQQPWQKLLAYRIRQEKSHIAVHGYIHSGLTNLPTQIIYHSGICVDRLFVHGDAYKDILIRQLNWDEDAVSVINSMRYETKLSLSRTTMFFAYALPERELLMNCMRSIKGQAPLIIQGASIRPHPLKLGDRQYVSLTEEVRNLVGRPESPVANNATPVAIMIGVSTVIFEALEAGYEVHCLFGNPDLERFDLNIWKCLVCTQLPGNENYFIYRLKTPSALIRYS